MPRVSIKRKEYKLNDLKGWVVAQMRLHHKTQAEVGQALGISQSALSQMLKTKDKKNGKQEKIKPDPFSYGDLLTLCELFEVSEEEKQRLLTM